MNYIHESSWNDFFLLFVFNCRFTSIGQNIYYFQNEKCVYNKIYIIKLLFPLFVSYYTEKSTDFFIWEKAQILRFSIIVFLFSEGLSYFRSLHVTITTQLELHYCDELVKLLSYETLWWQEDSALLPSPTGGFFLELTYPVSVQVSGI